MSIQAVAIASAKSFGDFVIAHSVLHRVDSHADDRIRMIACSHLKGLNAILPDDVSVTLVDTGEDRVPAVFDVKKCGALAAVQSALSLRRVFQGIERNRNEHLAFDILGARERFIAGRWPVISPRIRRANIYETYAQFLAEKDFRSVLPEPLGGRVTPRSIGIFPESRLVAKRLDAITLSAIFDRAARAGLDARLFVLEGDVSSQREFPCVVNISRDFRSLAAAIRSVDLVISADSLPAHLAEYIGRPVFVASPAPNEYWLPHGCFTNRHWGIFGNTSEFTSLLDRFLTTQ
jgi:hypothetical protein